jgi:hypothetical protein
MRANATLKLNFSVLLQSRREYITHNLQLLGAFEGLPMAVGARNAGPDKALSDTDRAERLVYLADMVSELQDLAAREGCVTLAGLLALAHLEALTQARTT